MRQAVGLGQFGWIFCGIKPEDAFSTGPHDQVALLIFTSHINRRGCLVPGAARKTTELTVPPLGNLATAQGPISAALAGQKVFQPTHDDLRMRHAYNPLGTGT